MTLLVAKYSSGEVIQFDGYDGVTEGRAITIGLEVLDSM